MARAKKNQTNPVDEMPVFEVQPVMGEPTISQPVTERKDNVIPFTGGEQAQDNRDTAEIDQFLSQFGIHIV